jgi:hypothetical protein
MIMKLAPKASTRKGCERCYNLDINVLCAQSQHSNVEQVLVESCDEAIGKKNDHLKREVKKLEFEVNKLKKQTKVQLSQDNHSNIVTPPTTTTRLGGVTTLQDNNKTKAIENMGINLKDQSKRKQLPTFNLNQ